MAHSTSATELFNSSKKRLLARHNQTFLPWHFSLFIGRSLFTSSGSCHDRHATWQEIGHTCGSECSCPRPGSRIVIPRWQEPEEELNKLLLMKASDRDRNVKVKCSVVLR